MGEDYKGDYSLRLLGRYATGGVNAASGDDLQNYETSKLPTRALAWAANTLMYFDRNDNSTITALAGTGSPEPISVKPNSGPGCWKAISGPGFDALGIQLEATLDNVDIVVTAANTWSAFGIHGWSSGGLPLSTPPWTFNTSGVLTYAGPAAQFQADIVITALNAIGATTQVISLAGTNTPGTIIGATTDLSNEGRTTATLQLEQQLTYMDSPQLGPLLGTTYQPIFRSVNGDDYTLIRAMVRLTPLYLLL